MSIQAAIKVRTNLDALTYAHKVWEAIDTPTSLSCSIMLRHGEYAELISKCVDPSKYVDPYDFYLDYQAVSLLTKYPHLDTGIDTEKVAKEKFDRAELLCKQTNDRFRNRDAGHLFDERVERVLSHAARKIASILGDVPSLERMEFSFGPGAAYGVRRETSVFNKVSSTLECTYAFADKLQEFLEEFPGWVPPGIHEVTLIPGSQLTFVPKNAKTDRAICIEPLLNGLYQKGVGSFIRKRLRQHGINLDDQGTNQFLASQAHLWDLATVDFSSASDTISYRTVMDLLPFDWFQFLDVARCPRFLYKGTWTNFQKFSSMGNAYTFELETLIFYAIAYACCEEVGVRVRTGLNLSVYGDDVILPQCAYDLFSEVTGVCGFVINEEKSFREGSFFESCGHDYFQGILVRPFLIKKRLNSLLSSFYAANTIHRIKNRLPNDGLKGRYTGVIHRFDGVLNWVVGRIPRDFRVMGPEGYGDGHLICEFDQAATSRVSRIRRDRQFDGWWFFTYSERAIRVKLDECPNAYASYFCREPIRREPSDGSTKILPNPSEPLHNGSGYALRGKTRIERTKVYCHGSWRGPNSLYWISDDPNVQAY